MFYLNLKVNLGGVLLNFKYLIVIALNRSRDENKNVSVYGK